ncbi:MAG: prepilin-type N-terminal cleavage/methylation domain-containing protein [Candidatus Peribacteria bacterium]|nr:prepilin-type N-terminal cleavage/methylation domain-containing protein [Candidatus Peribacteria bacterium]
MFANADRGSLNAKRTKVGSAFTLVELIIVITILAIL